MRGSRRDINNARTHLELIQPRCLLNLEEDLVSVGGDNLDVKGVVCTSAELAGGKRVMVGMELTIGLGLLLSGGGSSFRHVD